MKKLLFIVLFIGAAMFAQAQLNPVTWTFSFKKIGNKTYEIHMTAIMQSGWHLYSQVQPEDAIVIPTTFTLNRNPLITKDGNIKEIGKMQVFHDPRLDISAHQYANKVDFVQVVKLKANAKTNFSGNVEYQTCDDHKCLPPKKVDFNIALK